MKRKSLKFKNNLPLMPMSNISNQKLIIPLYHSIYENQQNDFISPLYQTRNLEKFEEDLDYFSNNFRAISLQELIEINKSDKKIKEPCFHITFDDGLSSFYNLAAPLLKKKGILATCFLNNHFIDNKGLFYRYKVGLICQEMKSSKQLEILKKHFKLDDESHILKKLKGLNYNDTEKIDELLCELGIDSSDFLAKEKPYMDEEQISTLIKDGFTFGAHSTKHISYNLLNVEQQVEETTNSIQDILERFKLKYKAFAFPFTDHGISASFFDKMKTQLDISFGTAGLKNKEYGYHYHRIIMEDNVLSAEQIIKAEYLYYLLKAPFGKNSIQRK